MYHSLAPQMPSFCFWLACLAPALTSAGIPLVRINLDDPPRDRWRPAGIRFKTWFHEHGSSIVTKVTAFQQWWSSEQLKELRHNVNISAELEEEMQGYMEAVDHPNATMELIMDLAMHYELGFAEAFGCTGLVVPKADGTIMFGRNMDVHIEDMWYQDILFEAVFMRQGKELARAITLFGWVGIHTGVRLDNGFALGMNTRFEKDGRVMSPITSFLSGATSPAAAKIWVRKTLEASRIGGRLATLTLRQALLGQSSFVNAVEALVLTPFLAPLYVIMAGAEKAQGAIITVGRTERSGLPGMVDLAIMGEGSGNWFLAQTNDDKWEAPQDPRRNKATGLIQHLKQKGKGNPNNEDVMLNILRAAPICFEGTLFSWVCTPANGRELLMVGNC